jgi:sucrose-6-phosphate hydrolase SacC (GH32 family)
VICPHIVPNSTNAGNIGDSYVFAEPPWDKPVPTGEKRTFFVLSGSNVCGPNDGHWCGYAKGTPQSLLFSSEDLVNWSFKNVFWRGPFTGPRGNTLSSHGSLYTPDTFTLPDGRQVLIYLMSGTLWQIGSFDAENGTFTAEQRGVGKVSAGAEEGIGSCGQSLTDAKGRRVQFGWQHISLQGTSGAQSLPRVITAAPEAEGGGLRFSPLPELETLHNASAHLARSLTVDAGQSVQQAGIDQATGLHHHIKLNLTVNAKVASSFSVCVQCDSTHPGVAVSFVSHQGTVRGRPALVVSVGGSSQTVELPIESNTVVVGADIFSDGQIVELFALDGQVALSHIAHVDASGIAYKASGAAARVELELWGMEPSVF